MDQDQARLAAQQVMSDFGEVGVVELTKDQVLVPGIALQQNTPNPFTEKTTISYQIKTAGQVRLSVYNVAGQLVRTLIDAQQQPGLHSVVWQGLDDQGRRVSSGIYFYRLESEGHTEIKKLTVLR